MNFDFYNQYKIYANTDLLKIIQQPDHYQEDAVKAATQLLNEREVSESDIENAKSYYLELDNSAKQRTDKLNSYKEKTADFLEPVLHPTSNVNPEKWLTIFLFTIVLQYLWILYINISDFIKFIKYVVDCKTYGFDGSTSGTVSYWACFTSQFNPFIFFQLLTLVYVPIIFYLLFKRKRWGWILLFADTLFGLISMISQSYIFFKYQQYYHGDTISFFTNIIIKGLFVFFLWKNYISDSFGVTKNIKKNTAIITTIITVILILIIPLLA